MSTLDNIIEQKAKELFEKEVKNIGQTKFLLGFLTIQELWTYVGSASNKYYPDYTVGKVLECGLGGDLIRNTCWPKLKDKYIERYVNSLEEAIMPEPNIQKHESDYLKEGVEYVVHNSGLISSDGKRIDVIILKKRV